ncbi:hypothetical protein JVX93_15910 [Mycolicibacterium boenickei]|nr:hypothetical protein JVX93_15910 [Mycolicibacterium boenickei]
MGVWVVDPDWYFTTAEALGRAASELAGAAGTITARADFASLHMAGNDSIGTSWGTKYDAGATNTVQGVSSLCRAWSALAGRIYRAGVNHAWADYHAGRGKLPTPANLPHEPAITQPTFALQTSVGGNRIGIDEVMPGLLEAIGTETPNANTDKLGTATEAWTQFGTTISNNVDKILNLPRPDPSLPDATAFYDTIVRVSGPGEALATDAHAMSSQVSTFASGVSLMRQQTGDELYRTMFMVAGTGAISIVASAVTGGVSVRVEAAVARRLIQRAGSNIREYIKTLETTAAIINTFKPAFDAAMKAALDKNSLVAAEGFERRPDGTIKPTIRYFDRAKWEAWQRYLERGGDWDIDRWSQAYDQLKENAANGWWYDQHVAEVMGYLPEHGWQDQWGSRKADLPDVPVPNRVWDWANPDLQELVENKSGALDFHQLSADEMALRAGWRVTWNINANYPYSESELAALARLEKLYPGKFTVNRI